MTTTTTTPLTDRQAYLLNNLSQASQDLVSASRDLKGRVDAIIESVQKSQNVPGFSNALGTPGDDVNALVARRKALIEALFMMQAPNEAINLAASDARHFFMENETFEVES